MEYKIFTTTTDLLTEMSKELQQLGNSKNKVNISLSGGSTPKKWFELLAKEFADKINWQNLHFWWGDERMVEASDAESNFGQAKTILFDKVDIPSENLHPIRGENDPYEELTRFSTELQENVPNLEFDWIILGVGEDGHTASLFPKQTYYDTQEFVILAKHPETGQLRISKSALLLSKAKKISYLVTGESKAGIVAEIILKLSRNDYPAEKIHSTNGATEWLLDEDSARTLKERLK